MYPQVKALMLVSLFCSLLFISGGINNIICDNYVKLGSVDKNIVDTFLYFAEFDVEIAIDFILHGIKVLN